jgi:hypothetical protein
MLRTISQNISSDIRKSQELVKKAQKCSLNFFVGSL